MNPNFDLPGSISCTRHPACSSCPCRAFERPPQIRDRRRTRRFRAFLEYNCLGDSKCPRTIEFVLFDEVGQRIVGERRQLILGLGSLPLRFLSELLPLLFGRLGNQTLQRSSILVRPSND